MNNGGKLNPTKEDGW